MGIESHNGWTVYIMQRRPIDVEMRPTIGSTQAQAQRAIGKRKFGAQSGGSFMRMPANMKLYYGGAWQRPNGGYTTTLNPATGEILAQAPSADSEEVDRCVEAAWNAFPEWGTSAP